MHIRGGIFSFTAPTRGPDVHYQHWHLMDHMPEQYSLPGIALGQRWIADGKYLDARLACEGAANDIGNVVSYLVRDPVVKTLDSFIELGTRLSEAGRYPIPRPALQISAMRLLHCTASPQASVAPEVVSFRPHRGVLLLVEEPVGDSREWLTEIQRRHLPDLMRLNGIAGAWMFGSTDHWEPSSSIWSSRRQYVTTVYLDQDPLPTVLDAAELVRRRWATSAVRPVFAGPFRTMVSWDAWA